MNAAKIRVVVVDDQPVVRAGMQMMIDAEPDMQVVGMAGDGETAIDVCGQLRPDVVLMDIRMPHLDGIQATERILTAGDASAVLMITTFDDEEYLFESMRAGASGFILKDAGPDIIAAALRSALRGDALIDPGMTRAFLERHARRAGESATPHPDIDAKLRALSPRERDVLTVIARGLTNVEIAHQLSISEATVKTHISNVMTKIGARGRAAVAAFAYESGHVRPSWSNTPPGEPR